MRNSVHEGTISSAAAGSLFDATTDSYSLRSCLGSRCIEALFVAHYPSQPYNEYEPAIMSNSEPHVTLDIVPSCTEFLT